MDRKNNYLGSIWNRWDPHIHTPRTLVNDYDNQTSLDNFIQKINEASPKIRALGITDYYVLDSYERILPSFEKGLLPDVNLIFPNIELRFAVNAGKGSPINVHLLVSPDDKEHIVKTKRFLRDLKFEYDGEDYACINEDLVRLGKVIEPDSTNERHLLKTGAEQFKVSSKELSNAFKSHQWARENMLIAVAASSGDGVGQLQEGGLKALREQLQIQAHIIFSGRKNDSEYWCGNGVDSKAVLKRKYKCLKPCLHGSDAHDLKSVGNPDLDRFCWLKGDLTFETLRQICFEPERRVYIGKNAPSHGLPSQTIKQVKINNADWFKNSEIKINSGLVAIIGARGSGKTALVEMIAAGAGSVDQNHSKRSFLERAQPFLMNSESTVEWGSGEPTSFPTDLSKLPQKSEEPRVRYLSQQFVDLLCSSDGLADELVKAIEQVIFDAHDVNDRLGARSFEELREIRTATIKSSIDNYQLILQEIGDEMSIQDDLKRSKEDLEKKYGLEAAAINRLKEDRKKITPSDNKPVLDLLNTVREATELKSRNIASLERRQLKLEGLKETATQFRGSNSEIQLQNLKIEYSEAKLTDEQWNQFKLSYKGDVMALLTKEIGVVSGQLVQMKGPSQNERVELEEKAKAQPYMQSYDNLGQQTHSLLLKEQRRLEALIGLDSAQRKRYTDLSNKIIKAETDLKARKNEIDKAKAAAAKIDDLFKQRQVNYELLIAEIEKEEKLLAKLYKPLQERLNSKKGTLSKLNFSVNRIVDIDQWSELGERMLDRSRVGPFKGVGTLTNIIKAELAHIWRTGSSKEISQAMSAFRKKYGAGFWKHAYEEARQNRDSKKHWYSQISTWLYSVDHVKISYGLSYEGVDVQQLSPGTRGIVLLLLYLSIDVDDERPLIIDQPEENLDPKSIFEELVEEFKTAKSRRQIIIVTHNANLVVNTDADQVIVASRGKHKQKALPDISYVSGGLENPAIRQSVCNILEGGKSAFEERAKRLRISL